MRQAVERCKEVYDNFEERMRQMAEGGAKIYRAA